MRAATANTAVVDVGPAGVTVESGFPLPAGEEVEVQIAEVSKVYVTANPAGNSQQHVVLAGTVAGESFTLSLKGVPTTPISTGAAAADVKTALEGVVGEAMSMSAETPAARTRSSSRVPWRRPTWR